jgi:hypothetical protein
MGHQEGRAMTTPPRSVGIDVAKGRLDRAVRPTGDHWHVANDATGIAQLVTRLDELRPALITLEATGGYERAVVSALAGSGLPVAVVNPRQVRDFAKATGKLAKTDALDAAALAHFAEAVQPAPREAPREQDQALVAVLVRRRQVVTMLTAEQNRLHTAAAPVRERIAAHIAWLEEELATLDGELARTIDADPLWRERKCPAPRRARRWPHTRDHVARGIAGTRGTQPASGRRPRRRRATQPRQRHIAGEAHRLGRTRPPAGGALHGGVGRDSSQPAAQGLLPASPRSRQTEEGGADRVHA